MENNASDPDSIGDCYNVKKLEKQVILDRTTLEKRISGGEKAAKTKKISELKGAIAELSNNVKENNRVKEDNKYCSNF